MKPTKLALIVGGVLIGLLILSKLVSVAFAMVSAKDDVQVLVGASILIAIVVGLVWGGAKLFQKIIPSDKAKETPKSSRGRNVHTLLTMGLLGAYMISGAACSRVPAGYVGIKIDNYGKNRGVEDIPLVTGWVWYNPFTESVETYPCFVQTAVWTKNPNEGSPNNEELTFNIGQGIVVSADISLSYEFTPEKIPNFYVKFRSDDVNKFTHGFLHNTARDAFNEIAPGYTVEDLYGPKKEEMLLRVRERINKEIAPIGGHLVQFGFIGALRPPESITEAMNAKAKAIQDAIRVENELRQQTAEAAKVIAKAKGEAEANALLTKSIAPELIQWRQLQIQEAAIQKWDGKRPLVESGAGAGGLLMQIPLPETVKSPK